MQTNHEPGQRLMTALLTARPEKQDELSNTLRFLADGLRERNGCLESLVARDLTGEARFILHLLWRDAQALDAYLASDDYRVLQGASSILTGPGGFALHTAVLPEAPS